jgi:hypothetical protein
MARMVSASLLAGPRVATIFVLRMATSYDIPDRKTSKKSSENFDIWVFAQIFW